MTLIYLSNVLCCSLKIETRSYRRNQRDLGNFIVFFDSFDAFDFFVI